MMQNTCSESEQTGMTNDPRYNSTGMETDEYTVQDSNGVLAYLTALPKYGAFVPDYLDKQNIVYDGWIRPTINWSLECEANGYSRQQGFQTVQDN
jgi:hypothetical protein